MNFRDYPIFRNVQRRKNAGEIEPIKIKFKTTVSAAYTNKRLHSHFQLMVHDLAQDFTEHVKLALGKNQGSNLLNIHSEIFHVPFKISGTLQQSQYNVKLSKPGDPEIVYQHVSNAPYSSELYWEYERFWLETGITASTYYSPDRVMPMEKSYIRPRQSLRNIMYRQLPDKLR